MQVLKLTDNEGEFLRSLLLSLFDDKEFRMKHSPNELATLNQLSECLWQQSLGNSEFTTTAKLKIKYKRIPLAYKYHCSCYGDRIDCHSNADICWRCDKHHECCDGV